MLYTTLKKQFDHVSDLFKDDVEWTNHESVPDEPISVDRMEIIHFNRYISSGEAIKEMKKTHRPATHFELIAYAGKYPDSFKEYPIIALGSFALRGSSRYVAVLWSFDGRRFLVSDRFDDRCPAESRVLFVRKMDTGILGASEIGTLDAKPSVSSEILPSVLEWESERMKAWDMYVAASLASPLTLQGKERAERAGTYADLMLEIRDIRFPKPTK